MQNVNEIFFVGEKQVILKNKIKIEKNYPRYLEDSFDKIYIKLKIHL